MYLTESVPIVSKLLIGMLFLGSLLAESIPHEEEEQIEFQDSESAVDQLQPNADREGKFFPFYGFPKFENVLQQGKFNSRCVTYPGDKLLERHGICAGKAKCRLMGGTDSDRSCDSKFGFSCCILNVTCDRTKESITVKKDFIYIRHEQNGQECLTDYKFPRQNNVCQLKLEFKKFNLFRPNTEGDCIDEKMTIRKADNLRGESLVICGKAHETDHLYLHYGETNEIVIHLDVAQRQDFGDVDILVRQIKCNAPDLAPEGCSQYFMQQRGDVRSFNFDPVQGQQLNNQIYSVCIKGSEGSNSVKWSPCNGTEDFDISSISLGTMPPAGHCPTDSVTIPGAIGTTGKFCIPESIVEVRTKAKPYLLYVHLDAQEKIPMPPPLPGGGCPPPWVVDPTIPGQCVPGPDAPPPDLKNRGFCLRFQRD